VLVFNRHAFSFRDGIYDAFQLAFYPFDARAQWPAVAHAAQTAMESLAGQPGYYPLKCDFEPPKASVATMKFFDMPFGVNSAHLLVAPEACASHDESVTPFSLMDVPLGDILCPEVVRILEAQELYGDTVDWVFAMLGRLLFDVGKLDNWQVVLFLKCVAGSGKSMLATLMTHLFGDEMVGTLSSNIEATFGLEPLYMRQLIVCPEVKRDFGVSQGDLQEWLFHQLNR